MGDRRGRGETFAAVGDQTLLDLQQRKVRLAAKETKQIIAMRLDAADRRSPPVGAGDISPLALKRCSHRTALAMLTLKRLAAAFRDMPPWTTASTTRSRRSSDSAIPAASFARRRHES